MAYVNIIDSVGNASVPIQLAQCSFPGLGISNVKIRIHFLNKIYGHNFIKQHSETVVVSIYKNADSSLKTINLLCYLL